MPSNVMLLFEIMIPIVMFDLLDSKFDWVEDQSVLKFDLDTHEVMEEDLFD